MSNMKTSLYNNDGTLSSQAQSLLSPKPDDMSIGEWRRLFKEFKSQLSEEDVKEFARLKVNAWAQAYCQQNKEERKAQQKIYCQKNKKELDTYAKAYRQKNKEEIRAYSRAYYQQNKEERRAYSKVYRSTSKYKEKIKAYDGEQRKTPKYKLRKAVRAAFERIKQNKPTNTLTLLGCTWKEAKAHIESLWLEGMTWENHGQFGWHIDHIRPVSSFKEDELHLMNRIENLQPLWWQDNLSKSNKLQY